MIEASGLKEMKVVVVQMKKKEYAIGVDVVESIEKLTSITKVPNTPPYVKGVINLRGVVTPIVDLRERLGIETQAFDDSTRIIIVSLEELKVGLIVDEANDVIDLPADSIEPPPEVVGSIESEFIAGVAKIGKRLFVMLNLDRVLQPSKRVISDEV